MALMRRDVPGEPIHPQLFRFDMLCWKAAAKLRATLTPKEVVE